MRPAVLSHGLVCVESCGLIGDVPVFHAQLASRAFRRVWEPREGSECAIDCTITATPGRPGCGWSVATSPRLKPCRNLRIIVADNQAKEPKGARQSRIAARKTAAPPRGHAHQSQARTRTVRGAAGRSAERVQAGTLGEAAARFQGRDCQIRKGHHRLLSGADGAFDVARRVVGPSPGYSPSPRRPGRAYSR